MSDRHFTAAWLQRREPFDTAARDEAAKHLHLAARLHAMAPPAGTPWRVIDLGCGTGANLRWLAPRLGGAQEWLVVDHDAALLREWPSTLGGPGFEATIVRQQADLALDLEMLPWHAAHLVTASALLDLVSEGWLQRMVRLAVTARAALLFTLSVDGRHEWTPPDPMDTTVGRLFAEHQRRDKGFGPALGARAVVTLQRALLGSGYRVFSASSDWWIDSQHGPQAGALQRALVDGIAIAASEQDPPSTAAVEAWRQRRHALAATGQLRVGHTDLLALP
ncbi:class I SAM-dependent methyltransferase [Hydrogenophaga laconesensis]|uniref:SAM-dependent methyltransferase n=1 Tax=Hydrogenophaga laconesensis TaxID=1805971 RepID=A0ABU1VDN9_9BURK|nr:class I SAM-dependent methyltransferase [Hydrogenophaga laconesensis]MDR7095591.1 SAM-dependent methyltransferase [Hydrogenophaga laconesensis]